MLGMFFRRFVGIFTLSKILNYSNVSKSLYMFALALCHFDHLLGPNVVIIVPRHAQGIPVKHIQYWRDIGSEDFFLHNYKQFSSANMIFDIPNPHARGLFDTLMVSLISDEIHLEPHVTKDLINSLRKKFCQIDHGYTALNRQNRNEEKYNEVYQFCLNYYEIILPTMKGIVEAQNEVQQLAKFPGEDPNPVLRISETYDILYFNEASAEIVKEWKEEGEFKVPNKYRNFIEFATKNQTPMEFEYYIDGQVFLFTIAPIFGESYVNLYGLNITESVNAQKSLLESEAKWRSFARNNPSYITIIDLDHTITYQNHPIEGYDLNSMINKPIYDFIDPKFHKTARRTIETVIKTGEPGFFESSIKIKEGQYTFLENFLGPIYLNEEIVSVTLIGNDITKRKEREHDLSLAYEMLDEILEATQNPIIIMDTNNTITQTNHAFAEMMGITKQEVIGRKSDEVLGSKLYFTPQQRLEEPVYTKRRVKNVFSSHNEKSEDILYQIVANPLRNKKGEINGMFELFRKIYQ